jgi:hypothetical protein
VQAPRKREPGRTTGTLKSLIPALAVVLLLAAWLPPGQTAPSIGSSSEALRTESQHGQLLPSYPESSISLTWTELFPEGVPPSNVTGTPVLVYDPLTQQVLDFASDFQGALTSVWGYDGATWTNVSPPGNLTHQDLTEFSVTFDTAAGSLLLFGYVGYNDEYPGDAETWTYAAGTWTELFLSTEPRGNPMAGVTFDPVDSSAILLTTLFQVNNSLTWAFHGGNWTQLETSSSPPALFGSTMAFDNSSADQELVLFTDGIQAGGPREGFWNQTWVYQGNQWLNVTATSGPAPPADPGAMTYDPSEQGVMLVDAGYFANGTPARTWVFTDGRWVYLNSPSMAPYDGIGGSNLAYDPHAGFPLLLEDGYSPYSANTTTQTWKFDRTDIGPPPALTWNVTPRNLTQGGTVHVVASATGGFGALGLDVEVNLPGVRATERGAGSWYFTTNGSGVGPVIVSVEDQSGRIVHAIVFVDVASPASPSTNNGLDYVFAAVAAVASFLIVVIVLVRRRKRGPPPASDESSSVSFGPRSQ